jgi:diguanylate cyclase (GGDEF)-like protein
MNPSTPASAETQESDGERPAILLVEDEQTTRLLLSRQLARAGYTVEAVSNGAEALATLKKRFFPLLITDWDMPKMDGLTLCKAVRLLPLEGYIYTILLTAREGRANMLEGLASGADDYLTKPPDDSELRARLNTGERILKLEQSLRVANRRIQILSITDALTAVFNRRYLMERLPQEIEGVRRGRRPLSVVLCDVDHFKQVNDNNGHQAGDQVLKGVAAILLGAVRKDIDWVARYGGEEFLLALPGMSVAEATALAERIRARIEGHPFEIDGGTCRISVSFGVAGYEPLHAGAQASVDLLIGRADRCLYQSKQSGRNRVTGEPPASGAWPTLAFRYSIVPLISAVSLPANDCIPASSPATAAASS